LANAKSVLYYTQLNIYTSVVWGAGAISAQNWFENFEAASEKICVVARVQGVSSLSG
jgi:hypothetical protein